MATHKARLHLLKGGRQAKVRSGVEDGAAARDTLALVAVRAIPRRQAALVTRVARGRSARHSEWLFVRTIAPLELALHGRNRLDGRAHVAEHGIISEGREELCGAEEGRLAMLRGVEDALA